MVHGSRLGVLGAMLLAATARPALAIPLPMVPARAFDVTRYGAVGNGTTVNTRPIQAAIAACTAAGGGTVTVPAGTFVSGPLTLASNLDLHLSAGATLRLTDDPAAFAPSAQGYANAIVADRCHDVSITGEGTIDGHGHRWWETFRKVKGTPAASDPATHRPYMVVFNDCTRVLVRGVTLANSPSFHLVPRACTEVTIDHVTFRSPADAPNTDGLDPSGWHYLITGCTFDVGDDCIAIKPSGKAVAGTPSCEDFTVADCTFLHGHGLSIGGQTPGGLRHLLVRHCTFDGTRRRHPAQGRARERRARRGPVVRLPDDAQREGADLHHQLLPQAPRLARDRPCPAGHRPDAHLAQHPHQPPDVDRLTRGRPDHRPARDRV